MHHCWRCQLPAIQKLAPCRAGSVNCKTTRGSALSCHEEKGAMRHAFVVLRHLLPQSPIASAQ